MDDPLNLETFLKVLQVDLDNKDSDKDLWSLKGTPPSDLMLLYYLVRLVPNSGSILELGTFRGKSAIIMGLSSYDKNINIYTIDNFKVAKLVEDKSETEAEARVIKNIEDFGVQDKVKLITKDSNEASKTWSVPLDLLFIDADHTYERVKDDILNFVPHLKPGGFLIFHDYTNPFGGVKQAIEATLKKDDFICYDKHYVMLKKFQDLSGILGKSCAVYIKKGNPEIERQVDKTFVFIKKPFGHGCNNCILNDFWNIKNVEALKI